MLRLLAILILPILATISLSSGTAQASTFDPGRIIDDVIFTNASSMSVAQIQSFLNSKMPACDTNGAQQSEMNNAGVPDYNSNGSIQRWEWGKYRYNQTTFPCLRDYTQDGVSAAQLIYNAAQTYSINPQVFIVLLQKEQGLVTDTWPLNVQYRSATGYGCPDTAPCDTQYYGLTNQLNWAGRLFRSVIDQNPSWYSPYVKGSNFIRWSPVASCGGSIVDVQNWSTAALYDYTPYQPNASALNAGYGMGDSCGAYGNRNFFLYFNDWFGSTTVPNFSAQAVWQQIYTDNTKATPLGWNATLLSGQSAHAVIVMKNTGNQTWTQTGAFGTTDTRLSTFDSWGRTSAFCDNTWVINCTRPAALKEASVAPGQYGTFEFNLKAPTQPGTYMESFAPIVDGRTIFTNTSSATITLTVQPATFSAQPVWQQVYTDNTKATPLGWNATLIAKQKAHAVIVMKNTGNQPWTKTGAFTLTDTRLATSNAWGRQSTFCSDTWLISCTRPSALTEANVAPGQYGTFEFEVQAPSAPGTYTESFAPIIDGRTVFTNGSGAGITFTVQPATFSAQPVWQQVYTDNSKTTPLGWNATLTPLQSAYAVVVMKNTGNIKWTRTGAFTLTDTRLATFNAWGRTSAFCDNTWVINCTRPAALLEDTVAPGQYGTFEFGVKAPASRGVYTESFAPVVDGRATFTEGSGAGISFTVQ